MFYTDITDTLSPENVCELTCGSNMLCIMFVDVMSI